MCLQFVKLSQFIFDYLNNHAANLGFLNHTVCVQEKSEIWSLDLALKLYKGVNYFVQFNIK